MRGVNLNSRWSSQEKWKRFRTVFATAAASCLIGGSFVVSSDAPAEADIVPAQTEGDTTAVLFQWPWDAIAEECVHTLGPAGYRYVQTSPVQEHIMGDEWWVHYQPVSYQLESRLGSREEFETMVQTCNEAGVEVIADVVINHMTGQQEGTGWAGTEFTHTDYPGTYGPEDFHNHGCEIQDYSNRWEVQECDLLGLADLYTSSEAVQETIAAHLEDFISIGVTGFRVDAVKHIASEDLEGIFSRTQGLDDVYIVQEVIRGYGEPIEPEEYQHLGDVHEFTYGRTLRQAFQAGDLAWLLEGQGIGETWDGFIASDSAGTFVDNHDTERNGETLSYKDGEIYELAQAFTLAWPYGSPAVHSGYQFEGFDDAPPLNSDGTVADPSCGEGTWTCMHARTSITGMVDFRNAVGDAGVTNQWTNDSDAIGFSRGDSGHLVLNRGTSSVEETWQSDLPAGEYCNVYLGPPTDTGCAAETITVAEDGTFNATVGPDSAVALHVGAMAGTGEEPTVNPADPHRRASIYYPAEWENPHIHYQIGSAEWTEVPGIPMEDACEGWAVINLDLGTERTVTAAFNDGSDSWDNNNDSNYVFGPGETYLADGELHRGNPCEEETPEPEGDADLVLFYATEWESPNIHFQVGDGEWTDVPGVPMAEACEGWFVTEIHLDGAESITAALNDGREDWDNNEGQDYTIPAGVHQLSGGELTAGDPCEEESASPSPDETPDPTEPSIEDPAGDDGDLGETPVPTEHAGTPDPTSDGSDQATADGEERDLAATGFRGTAVVIIAVLLIAAGAVALLYRKGRAGRP
ncbi:alpha-amylase [Nesterenkonia alkaliphila]|uniref:Alpha-amylase n=2 Tax=Nesterenkonia alkaliphila TaxID=1463631 RepID=A0A7K1ULQ8_9MICC|nr:alpha-amylase [Nesterenkonia alkaliphila]GFZ80562.1 hypothetical protein GCM10011359_06230 [Nesterenkonia alkaliphila]